LADQGTVKSYDKLFSIWFKHSDYPNSGSAGGILTDMMKLEPDDLTKTLFQQHDIHYRFKNDMILIIIRVNHDTGLPFNSLPNRLSMRFLLKLDNELYFKTTVPNEFSIDNFYRIKINLRSSANTSTLSPALLKQVEDRQPTQIFHPDNPSHWESKTTNLKKFFAVIDIVTEGSSTHRLFSGSDQSIFYSSNSDNYDKHLYTIQLK